MNNFDAAAGEVRAAGLVAHEPELRRASQENADTDGCRPGTGNDGRVTRPFLCAGSLKLVFAAARYEWQRTEKIPGLSNH